MTGAGGGEKTVRTAQAHLSIWYNEETGHIHLAIPDSSFFVTTVNDVDGSKRCHRNLYKKLARYLLQEGLPGPLDTPIKGSGKDTLDAPFESK